MKNKGIYASLVIMLLWGLLFPLVKAGYGVFGISGVGSILSFAGVRFTVCGVIITAFALLKNPKILILDDSTSAVDTRTDASIRAELKKFIPATTKIIIAQRIASVMDADIIIVMDGGKVSATGTHDELIKSSDIYREVYEQQIHTGEEE